jgi:hypothetical protein
MIALKDEKPDGPRDSLLLAISIERPSEQIPEGYVCMTAHFKSIDPEHPAIAFEDATDGPLTEETIESLIRDLRSYVANGRKAFTNDVERGEEPGGRCP